MRNIEQVKKTRKQIVNKSISAHRTVWTAVSKSRHSTDIRKQNLHFFSKMQLIYICNLEKNTVVEHNYSDNCYHELACETKLAAQIKQ